MPAASIHAARTTPPHGARVSAPGRLHLGFLDPAGTLGRRFGSLGLVIDGYETIVELALAERDAFSAAPNVPAAELERAAHLHTLRSRSGRTTALRLHLARTLPPHAGFGSGTQLALATGRAFARLHALDLPTPDIATWLGRGLRSGVGIAGFDQGGLLLDGGPSTTQGRPAPLLARLALPEDWRVIVVLDPRLQGLAGSAEKEALARLAPLPRADAAELCHQVLMQVLPGAAEGDFGAFARGLSRMQALLGAHFAPAQAAGAYASAAVARAMHAIAQHAGDGGAGIGQSSWGPTGFAIVPSAAAAATLLAAAQDSFDPALVLHVVRARNHGAQVEALPASQRAA